MDFTGSLQATDERKSARRKTPRMSYPFRAGQVGRLLETHSEVTIYDLARLLDMSPRQMHTICDRMAKEGRITVRQALHHNWFKHLISRK